MNDALITFEFEGKEYSGLFRPILRERCSIVFYFMVDNCCIGQLLKTANGWFFRSDYIPQMAQLSEFFGDYIECWYE